MDFNCIRYQCSHRLKLSELKKGLLIMRDKTEDYVKSMVEL